MIDCSVFSILSMNILSWRGTYKLDCRPFIFFFFFFFSNRSATEPGPPIGLMELEKEDFGQEQPPLYQLIRKILEEYPNGQIFKVYGLLEKRKVYINHDIKQAGGCAPTNRYKVI